jgi:RNA polymerase sigma-70 factor, ECF subfamily
VLPAAPELPAFGDDPHPTAISTTITTPQQQLTRIAEPKSSRTTALSTQRLSLREPSASNWSSTARRCGGEGGSRIVGDVTASSAAPAPGDDPIVSRAFAGDRDAERQVCGRLLPAMRAFAGRRLPPSAVDDFAHDALVIFVEALRAGRIQDPARAAAFALGICRNLARERARLGDRRRELLERYGLSDADLVPSDAPLVFVRREHLEDCYSQLDDRARRVVRATFYDDALDAEIAAALGITEANVRVIRHRSLAGLRSCLEKPISWERA